MGLRGPITGLTKRRFLDILECYTKQGIDLNKKVPASFFIPEDYKHITPYEFQIVAEVYRIAHTPRSRNRNAYFQMIFNRLFPELRATDITTNDETIKDESIDLPTATLEKIRDLMLGEGTQSATKG